MGGRRDQRAGDSCRGRKAGDVDVDVDVDVGRDGEMGGRDGDKWT